MEELDVHESSVEQVTAAPESGDDVVSVDAEAVTEGASESVSEDAPENPDRARARVEAERVQRMARPSSEAPAADLVCGTHGGELRKGPGKWRFMCDRAETPGSCVAAERDA